MSTILFPRKGDRLRAHSVFFQAIRVAASGIGVMSGMVPSRTSSTAIAVASGTYRNGNTPGAYAGGSLTSVPAASSGKLRFDLVVFDVSDTTLKRITGSEDTPTIIGEFLENLQPLPPELASASQILLGIARVSSNGIEAVAYGHYATNSIAKMIIELPSPGNDLYSTLIHASRHVGGGADDIAVATTSVAGLESSADKTKLDGIATGANVTATTLAPAIHAATDKTTPVDADELGITDSAASFVLKSLTWAHLKATLKTYFDGLRVSDFLFVAGTGDVVITTGIVPGSYYRVGADYTIIGYWLGEVSQTPIASTVVVNVLKKAGSYPATSDTICASAKPSLSADTDVYSTTLTGWNTTISAGDVLAWKIESNNLAQCLNLVLYLKRR